MKSQMLFTLEEYVGNGLWRQKIVGLDEYANAFAQHSYKPLPRRPRMQEREIDMVERVARALSIADGMHPDAASNDEDETPAWKLYSGAQEQLSRPCESPQKK
ncbi:hypothetical protein [Rhizobium hidalgonense]|uniref:hypothetical protein n=1 Tax=Rhizobium hidalgonense TaxID=1538159 RepID=UPI002871738E|nr:hypothetical protein [Rhizobium hidalgonense]MDR9813127.1 hypothetical protein [Rhizobium hidalgonense]